MEPMPLATYVATNSKFGYLSSESVTDDPEVVEVSASDCQNSTVKKRKRAKVVSHDVIEIDEDDDPAGLLIIGEKVSTDNKGKDKLTGYNKNWADQLKGALPQDLVFPGSATEFGMVNGIPMNPIKSSVIESKYLNTLNGGLVNYGVNHFDNGGSVNYGVNHFPFGGSVNYGVNHFPNSNNSALHYDGTTILQSPFYPMDLYNGLGAPLSGFGQSALCSSKPVMSSSSSVPEVVNSSGSKDKKDKLWLQQSAQSWKKPVSTSSATVPCQPSHTGEKEEVLKKYRSFKRFDTIGDYSDHHYANQSSASKQPPRNWAKAIQQEWKILEKDLPDTIFVRVYEERMDLLRGVIVGAAGTPYHDGLFFFDFFFSSSYPTVPPNVYYHSGGLRLNPNLYNCGKVCLSLLNTWHGSKEEKWTPRKSTVLQVLLSIQALVLNAKPFFNEPGYAGMAGGMEGEKMSHDYNENAYILSCRTMLYTLKRPPRHFEEFVVGHFLERAYPILVACKAYMDGAQVGCLVGGGVQDVDEGDKSGSQNFKTQVGLMVQTLVPAFVHNGSNECQQFLPQTNNNRNTAFPTCPGSNGFQYKF